MKNKELEENMNQMMKEFCECIQTAKPGSAEWEFCWNILNAVKDYKERISDE